MKRVWSLVALFVACAKREPPPRTEVIVPIEARDATANVGAEANVGAHGSSEREHSTRGHESRMGTMSVSGRLPPEVIQSVITQNFSRLRACYTRALAADATLAGFVTTKFVIDRVGNVSAAETDAPSMPTATVADCVVAIVKSLKFPQPEGGIVTVVYPIDFEPND